MLNQLKKGFLKNFSNSKIFDSCHKTVNITDNNTSNKKLYITTLYNYEMIVYIPNINKKERYK